MDRLQQSGRRRGIFLESPPLQSTMKLSILDGRRAVAITTQKTAINNHTCPVVSPTQKFISSSSMDAGGVIFIIFIHSTSKKKYTPHGITS